MTREEAINRLSYIRADYSCFDYDERPKYHALSMAIEALSADAVQGCDGCRYNTLIPQKQCLRCKRYWRDSYERKGGDTE